MTISMMSELNDLVLKTRQIYNPLFHTISLFLYIHTMHDQVFRSLAQGINRQPFTAILDDIYFNHVHCSLVLRPLLSLSILTVVVVPCVSVSSGYPWDVRTAVPGHVVLAALAEVNDPRDGGCGTHNVASLRWLMAQVWMLDLLNRNGYVPGITLGETAWIFLH